MICSGTPSICSFAALLYATSPARNTGAAGDIGKSRGDEAAGARLGDGDGGVPLSQEAPHQGLQLFVVPAKDQGTQALADLAFEVIQHPADGRRIVSLAGQADVDLAGMGQDPDGRIPHLAKVVADGLVNLGLADPAGLEYPGHDPAPDPKGLPDPGDHLLDEHGLHLRGDAGQAGHTAPAIFQEQPGRRPVGIRQHVGSLGDHGLLPVVLGHGDLPVREAPFDVGQDGRIQAQPPVQDGRHDVAGQVVLGGPQAAGGDDDVGSAQGLAQRCLDAGGIVPHRRLEEQVNARLGQPLGDPAGVGIHDLAQEQLGADGQDLGAHPDATSQEGFSSQPQQEVEMACRSHHSPGQRPGPRSRPRSRVPPLQPPSGGMGAGFTTSISRNSKNTTVTS
jgi:hypothetical protein